MIEQYTYETDTIRLLLVMNTMPATFTMTGSRVYAPAVVRNDSDFDYIVNPKVMWHNSDVFTGLISACSYPYTGVIMPTIERSGPEYGDASIDENQHLVYIVGQRNSLRPKINMIFLREDIRYFQWLSATYIMKMMRGKDEKRLENKEARLLCFHAIVAAVTVPPQKEMEQRCNNLREKINK